MVALRGKADENMRDEYKSEMAEPEAKNDIEHFLFALSESFFCFVIDNRAVERFAKVLFARSFSLFLIDHNAYEWNR